MDPGCCSEVVSVHTYMDRRYGSDPLAPPRPPKSLPRVHRPRAPEPPIMSESSQSHPLNDIHTQPPQSIPPPATAPLVSLQSSTSSRRRPPPPLTFQIPTLQLLSSSLNSIDESPLSPVTLAEPRPEKERLANEYVDTPFRTPNVVSRIHHHHGIVTGNLSTRQTTSAVQISSTTASSKPFVPHSSRTASTTTIPSTQRTATHRPHGLPVITKQPQSFSKDIPLAALRDDVDMHPSNGESLNSILCPQCKRCRCEECQRPRQLPSRWVCDNWCLCSAESFVDYSSCLCCVKALFYHCSNHEDHEMERDGDSISCADDPCSCLPHRRTQRWAWLGALSIALPCLWCYWPMRGCVSMCAKCYARHYRHGCRCPQTKASISGMGNSSGGGSGTNTAGRTASRTQCEITPEKRLLDTSPEY